MADRMCSRWLAAARWDDGLLVPGRPRRSAVDLRLRPDGIEVRAGSASALVPWEMPSWSIGAFAHGRYGNDIGAALILSGEAADRTAAVRRTRRNRLLRRIDGRDAVAPLLVQRVIFHRHVRADRDGLRVLLRVLADRPSARARLGSQEVVERLLADVRTRPHGSVHRPEGVGRRTFEVMKVLRDLDHWHPVGGRPLPGDAVASADEITDHVMARLAANRYLADVDFERDEVRDLVVRHHTGIEPWPFEALLL